MASELTRLRKSRGGFRAIVTVKISEAEKLLDKFEFRNEAEVQALRDFLIEKFTAIKDLDKQILDLITEDAEEEAIYNEVDTATDYTLKINKVLHTIDHILLRQSDVKDDRSDASSFTRQQRVRLPKIELGKFSGDPQKFQGWWDEFDSLIHQNDLSEIDKFHYLKSLLTGDALNTISGLPPTSQNYKHALDILSERYGRKEMVISSHMESILKIPFLQCESTNKLRRAYDSLQSHIRSLQSLGIESKNYGCILVPVIKNQLPADLRLIIERKFDTNKDYFKLDDFMAILHQEIDARERCGISSMGKKGNGGKGTGQTLHTGDRSSKGSENNSTNCCYCSGKHASENCKTIAEVGARKAHLRKTARCFNCLMSKHRVFKCRSAKRCEICGSKHHVSICENKASDKAETDKPSEIKSGEKTGDSSVNMFCNSITSVLMLTARGNVCKAEGDGEMLNVRFIFDNCSSRTYITNFLRERLRLRKIGKGTLNISRFMDEDTGPLVQTCDVVQLRIKGKNSDDVIISAWTVPSICPPPNVEKIKISKQSYPHLAKLTLADETGENRFREDQIDVMIGLDYYYAFIQDETKRGKQKGPVATKSILGWLVGGPVYDTHEESDGEEVDSTMMTISSDDQRLDKLVENFWSLEAMGILAEKEQDVMQHFVESVWFNNASGRYSVSLPWRSNKRMISDNYEQALRRLHSLLRRFQKDTHFFKEYNSVMKDQLEKGILEYVPDEPPDVGECYYIPHHAVLREDHSTTKLRVVYDASSKIVGPSLNNCLHEGPSLLPELIKVLLSFRSHKIGLVADVEKAFLNVEIDETDRDYLRCLWVDNLDPSSFASEESLKIILLRFTRVVFGVTSSPFHLLATFRVHFDKYRERYPEIVNEIERALYVDDLNSGADEVEDGYEFFVAAKGIFQDGGFNLRKFATNSDELLKIVSRHYEGENVVSCTAVDEQSYADMTQNSIERPRSEVEQKVLGVVWNKQADTLVFRFESLLRYTKDIKFTKRTLLRLIARIYDPLGLICPIVVLLKCVFQEVCQIGLDWDNELPTKQLNAVRKWLQNLAKIESLEFPRHAITFLKKDLMSCQLIGFSDSSQGAFGVAIYARLESKEGIDSNLIFAKSRVAPPKRTLPQKELLGAVLLSNVLSTVQGVYSSLPNLENHLFSDSETVLCWIKNENERYKQFVENRAVSIRESTEAEKWKHVRGDENPADLTTRPISPSDLNESVLWRKGPEWLRKPICDWPVQKPLFAHTDESLAELRASDRKKLETSMLAKEENIACPIKAERYSSMSKLLRVTAYVYRFINNCRKTVDSRRGELQLEELQDAEKFWIKLSQNELKSDNKFGQIYKQLRIYRDDQDILRAKGRLEKSSLPFDQKFPIVLPAEGYFVELLVSDAHWKILHGGVNDTMAFLRERFWVLRLRQVTRKLVNKCFVCKLIEGKAYSSRPFPPLPRHRINMDHPFETSGTDFAGPLYVKTLEFDQQTVEKAYILLFTCTSTRAVHLELVNNLEAPTFLLAFRRFIGRRGAPKLVISDNAKAFKAAETKKFLQDRGISWQFNMPRAPWTGGVFERMIKSTKRCLKKVLLRSSLNFHELSTMLIEVENMINNRPLTYIDTDGIDETLTPNHLIHGRRLPIFNHDPVTNPNTKCSTQRRFLYRSKVLKDFVKRWEISYLAQLRQSNREHKTNVARLPKLNDVVLVHDNSPRLSWKIARVVELLKSSDDVCRAAVIRMCGSGKLLKRAIRCLYPLEEGTTDEHKTASTKDLPAVSPTEADKEPLVERGRAAAKFARQRLRDGCLNKAF